LCSPHFDIRKLPVHHPLVAREIACLSHCAAGDCNRGQARLHCECQVKSGCYFGFKPSPPGEGKEAQSLLFVPDRPIARANCWRDWPCGLAHLCRSRLGFVAGHQAALGSARCPHPRPPRSPNLEVCALGGYVSRWHRRGALCAPLLMHLVPMAARGVIDPLKSVGSDVGECASEFFDARSAILCKRNRRNGL
jgi:hypothetical protein